MPYTPTNSAGVHPVGIPLLLVAIPVIAAIGGAAEAAVIGVPFRWLVPLYTVIAAVGVGAVLIGVIRVGRVRGIAPSAAMAMAVPFLYFAGVVTAAYLLAPEARQAASSPLGVFFGRFTDGLRMTGGVFDPDGFRVGGIWIALLWAAEAFTLVLVAIVVAALENQRAFCDRCGRWANRRKWTFGLRPFPGSEPSVQLGLEGLLTRGTRASPTAARFEYHLDSCRCGAAVTLAVATVAAKSSDGSASEERIYQPHLLSPPELERVFAWAEAIDPMMATVRPALTPVAPTPPLPPPTSAGATPPGRSEFGASSISKAESAALLPPLERDARGEVKVRIRWRGAIYQEDFSADCNQTTTVRQLMNQGHFDRVAAILQSVLDPTTRAVFAESAASWYGESAPTEAWAANQPFCSEARLVRGIRLVKHAWDARGGDWVPKNFPLFQDRLNQAQSELLEAAAMNPADGVPHAWLILVSMGLQDGPKAATEHFKESVRRQPSLRQPHTFLVQALCSKWGGDDQQMVEFARKAAARAGVGSTIPTALANAYQELAWAAQRDNPIAAAEYLARTDIRSELLAASQKTFPVSGPLPSIDAARSREIFAAALWHAGLFDEALRHLELLPRQPVFHRFGLSWMFWRGDTRSAAIRACNARRLPKS